MPRNIFRIYDGRNYFWQWDTGQKLIVLNDDVDEVHFSNSNMAYSIPTKVYAESDGTRVCDVPDIILMLPKNLIASAYETDGPDKTIKTVKFAVRQRPIPADYIPGQSGQVSDLVRRLEALEEMFEDSDMGEAWNALNEEIARAKAAEEANATAIKNTNDNVNTAQSDVNELKTLVGDTAVDDQIDAAIEALKIGDYAKTAELTAAIADIKKNKSDIDNIKNASPQSTTITVLAANWVGDTSPFSQVVTVNGVTENSKVDLQPTAAQIVELQDDETSLMTENNDGVITVWAIGDKPATDMEIQALVTEVAMT